jgi:hypothetical protein
MTLLLDDFIFESYHKYEPKGSSDLQTFRLGSNLNQKGPNPMIEADSVLSTPPLSSSSIQEANPPVEVLS